jgi:hypothetical protein
MYVSQALAAGLVPSKWSNARGPTLRKLRSWLNHLSRSVVQLAEYVIQHHALHLISLETEG